MCELMKLLSTKSMIRYLLPKGTAGLLRSFVSGCRRSPRPPARISPRIRDRAATLGLRQRRGGLDVLRDVREAEVLSFLGGEKLFLVPRQGPAVAHALGHLVQPPEVRAVLREARLGVVARGPRRDEKLPVRRLQQQQLPSHLSDEAPQQRAALPSGRRGERPQVVFRLVDHLPGPLGVFVQPDPVVAALAPRPLEQRDRGLDGKPVEAR